MWFLRGPTLDVNFDWRTWQTHTSIFRHLEEWSPKAVWTSSTFRRVLFPDVVTVGLTSSILIAYNQRIADQVMVSLDTDGDGIVSLDEVRAGIEAGAVEAHSVMGTDFFTTVDMLMLHNTTPFTLTALALGMMLTFRMQNCSQLPPLSTHRFATLLRAAYMMNSIDLRCLGYSVVPPRLPFVAGLTHQLYDLIHLAKAPGTTMPDRSGALLSMNLEHLHQGCLRSRPDGATLRLRPQQQSRLSVSPLSP